MSVLQKAIENGTLMQNLSTENNAFQISNQIKNGVSAQGLRI